jgi:hypothetical protein
MVYVCLHECMYARELWLYVCMVCPSHKYCINYACMHLCMYLGMHACIHLCMYVCMHGYMHHLPFVCLSSVYVMNICMHVRIDVSVLVID